MRFIKGARRWMCGIRVARRLGANLASPLDRRRQKGKEKVGQEMTHDLTVLSSLHLIDPHLALLARPSIIQLLGHSLEVKALRRLHA